MAKHLFWKATILGELYRRFPLYLQHVVQPRPVRIPKYMIYHMYLSLEHQNYLIDWPLMCWIFFTKLNMYSYVMLFIYYTVDIPHWNALYPCLFYMVNMIPGDGSTTTGVRPDSVVPIILAPKELTPWSTAGQKEAGVGVTKAPSLTQFPWTKWPPFRRRRFHMHFREWKCFYFNSNFTEVYS